MTATKKKLILTCAIMLVTCATFAFSTFAYFTDFVGTESSNMIMTGSADVEIIDLTYTPDSEGNLIPVPPDTPIRIFPGYEVEKKVSAKNNGTIPMFIRIKIDSTIQLASHSTGRESEIDLRLVGYDINEKDWMLHTDGYYYYRKALHKGQDAEPLFTKVMFSESMGNLYKDSTITFKIRIECVQANGNGNSPINAQNWSTPTEGGGS